MLLVNLHTDSCQELPLTNSVRGQYCKLRTEFFPVDLTTQAGSALAINQ